jgi:phosphinothricin acetyltransferase
MARIRLAHTDDAAAVAAIYSPFVEETAISFEAAPPKPDEFARRINQTLPTHPWLVCDIDGHVAGYACAAKHRDRAAYRWSVDTSVYVAASHQRCGIGSGLYGSLFAILAEQGYVNAYAGITLPNPASVRLHEALGFERLGVYRRVGHKFGVWHDVGWWQLALGSHEEMPAEPLELAALQGSAVWDELLSRGLASIRTRSACPGDVGRDGVSLRMTIRECQPEDGPAIVRLWERCGLTRPWNDPRQEIARKLNVQPELFVIGVSDEEIVATVMAGYDGHRGWIYSLAVAPEAQRRGLGRRMMREAERRLRAAGCAKVNLQIRGGNAGVAAFYRALGYVEEDRVSMGRRLPTDEAKG